MADFTTHLKSAAWTEAEVVAVCIGSVAGATMLDTRKIFKQQFAANPIWFEGERIGAPFHIRHFGLIKASGAVLASTYVDNPWIKLALMGVAVQGTLEEVRMLSFNERDQTYRFEKIGAGEAAKLDQELKKLAEKYRGNVSGSEFIEGTDFVAGNRGTAPYGERYESGVAGNRGTAPYGERFESGVAGIYDESEMSAPFSFAASDDSEAY